MHMCVCMFACMDMCMIECVHLSMQACVYIHIVWISVCDHSTPPPSTINLTTFGKQCPHSER